MELTIGEHAGFCFGVRRAVLKAFECAEKQLSNFFENSTIRGRLSACAVRASAAWRRSTR